MKHKYYNMSSKEHEEMKNMLEPEEYQLFSTLPPPDIIAEQRVPYNIESDSALEDMLGNSKPGLLDSNWVLQIRNAYISSGPLKNTVLMTLLEQMWQAIPTAEWADHYEWPENFAYNVDYYLMEELYGIDLISQYGELNGLIQKTEEVKKTFKQFLQASYIFIKYQKPYKFEGFDWFLSTVFLICEGDMDKCRKFITKFIRFPCIMFIWPILGKALDTSNNEECTTQFTFAQLLEGIIHNEMPNIAYALKNTCGTDWWLLCTTILNQCFLGILPWHEIMHFFAISVLYSPDYVLYYCVSLIYHCKTTFMLDITNGKMWPEYMVLHDYRCHDYIAFMDKLAKRYGSKVLPILTGRKLCDD